MLRFHDGLVRKTVGHRSSICANEASEKGVANANLYISGQHALNLFLSLMHSRKNFTAQQVLFKLFLKRAAEESSLGEKYPVIRLIRRPDWVLHCTMIQVRRYLRVSQTTGSQEITT